MYVLVLPLNNCLVLPQTFEGGKIVLPINERAAYQQIMA